MASRSTELAQYEPDVIHIHHSAAKLRDIKLTLLDIANLHPLASGNKLFKLALNIEYAIHHGYSHVLSFGGAFSNHIHALAAYGQANGVQTIGIIRGEPEYASNPTLKAAQECGMQLEFVDRKTYRLRHDADYLSILATQFSSALIIPEGGSNALAVEGCKQLAQIINSKVSKVDVVATACGTGGTLAGLVCGLEVGYPQQVLGFPVVRDTNLQKRIDELVLESTKVSSVGYKLIAADYGGYAKFDKPLLDFILDWLEQTGILLDPVYTSKMCRKLIELTEDDVLKGKHVCLLHTGGLQAWFGMRDKVIKLGGESAWETIQSYLKAI